MLILSIDPGLVNMGVCVFDTEQYKIVYANKVSLSPTQKVFKKEGEHTLVDKIYYLFLECKDFKHHFENADIVLIEQQMKRTMLLVQYVMGSICKSLHKEYKFITPRSIKTMFKTGKTARKGTSSAVRGKKNNHAANKKMAIAHAEKMFPAFMRTVSAHKKDDISDAVLQAAWYTNKYIIKK